MMMELTEQQKATVTAWVDEGCGLSEIQRRITSEFKLRPTFMDVRFLILDLGLEIKDASASATKKAAAGDKAQVMADDTDEEFPPDADLDGAGGVTVEVDRLIKPGALISGTVVFSDGMTAAWMLDQAGRLALDPAQPGYRPGPEDIEGFQRALQKEMMKKGY
jgi:hypothetical protein